MINITSKHHENQMFKLYIEKLLRENVLNK